MFLVYPITLFNGPIPIIKRPNGSCSSPSPAKKKLSASSRQGPNDTADIRVAEFGKRLFYVDSGHFCWVCNNNMVVNYVKKLPFSFDFTCKFLDFHREVCAILTTLTAKLPRFLRF